MANVYTKAPKRGDIVIKNTTTKAVKYIVLDTYTSCPSGYETVGVVAWREGNKVAVVYKTNSSLKYCNRIWWYLSGFTLDGTARTGALSLRFSSNWDTAVTKTFSYNASTIADFISQLNTAFAADSDMSAQDWYADAVSGDDTKVRIHCNAIDYRQFSGNAAVTGAGFTLTGSLPEVAYSNNMLRKSGYIGSDGAISCWAKAIEYFTSDNSSTNYNPADNSEGTPSVTSVKLKYPVCLPAYLGPYDATTNPNGTHYRSVDNCLLLRQTYGEGETGWLKFMKSCLPVNPCDYGIMGEKSGKALTKIMANKTYTSASQATAAAMCAGASYCYNINTSAVDAGEFWLPSTRELAKILDGVSYASGSVPSTDLLNTGLDKIGGSKIPMGSNYWSSCRCNSGSAWFAFGNRGFFGGIYMCNAYVCVPLSLYIA